MLKNNNPFVSYKIEHNIGLITIDYPPVNALSQQVRQGITQGIECFQNEPAVQAIIIQCAQKTFIAGADIKEFGQPPTEPFLPDVVNQIENCNKPVVAALFGTSLGGGFEVALACHYRVALANAKVGLPEVNLGLIPGAGGTQRLPRIVGGAKALQMITEGKHHAVTSLAESGLIDAIFPLESDLCDQTIDFVKQKLGERQLPVKRSGERPIINDVDWVDALQKIKRKARGKEAPVVAVEVLQQTCDKSLTDGMKIERDAFLKLRDSAQSAALRYAFSAEKAAAKVNFNSDPLPVEIVGVIGGGTMGAGIATAFLLSGFNVILIERDDCALAAGTDKIIKNLQTAEQRGIIKQHQYEAGLKRLSTALDYQPLRQCDLVIEAVFEDIQVKKEIFAQLGQICQPNCVLATNTSYLNIDEIALATGRPEQVIGMHFFSPANIMKLLEVVRAAKSSEQALATAMMVAKKLGKIAVLVGVCFGFAGNRMYTRYGREIQQMLLEGASIEQIDKAMTNWGMAMGPLAVQDLSGIDIGHNARSAQPFPEHDPGYFRAAAVMVENGRLGRKTGAGFYHYDESGKAVSDSKASELIAQKAQQLAIEQRSFTDDDIVERAILALISEGLSLYEEGIVRQLSDIDVIWLHGYGFPRHKGGPMFYARQLGVEKVTQLLVKQQSIAGKQIWPDLKMGSLS
ncbi:3-hydroxyacyl-CoA dehydrogenase NAD-binding domain-containing protein [Aliikangiella maris]|uniref:3-hydroxyacyl-CoA dehydrogenase NAD-binding domain-containing protein n=2 Tax=Aliikangiella maris TaxID=3162458 RepID=A0ABV3MLZ3_9GAMM